MSLASKHCRPCEGGEPPLDEAEAGVFLRQVPHWTQEGEAIMRDVSCKDFKHAIALVSAAAEVAEQEGHHPDILVHGYKHVRFTLTTHAIGGLSENDFILAAKLDDVIDRLL